MQTMGENDVLHPRARANPPAYGAAKSAVTAVGVATISAADRLFVDQLETNAVAAASALGLSVVGRTSVVVVPWANVVVGSAARVECSSPEGRRCT